MTRRFLFGLAAGLIALSLGAFQAQAGQVGLPATLDTLEMSGNYATVGNLRFETFSYVTNPAGSPPASSAVTVSAFTITGETGITFNGAFFAAAGQVVDYAIQYMVSTTDGSVISDAYLSLGGFSNFGGTGAVSIGETILDKNGNVLSKVPFDVFTPGKTSDTTSLSGGQSMIVVQKDITVFGGSNGAVFSFTNQGFSTTAIPEPTSMALLGIGLSGIFSLRRFLKRSVA